MVAPAMARRACATGLAAVLLWCSCEGSGSDIGPSIPQIPSADYRVVVLDDQGRTVTAALVSIEGFPATGSTGRSPTATPS